MADVEMKDAPSTGGRLEALTNEKKKFEVKKVHKKTIHDPMDYAAIAVNLTFR